MSCLLICGQKPLPGILEDGQLLARVTEGARRQIFGCFAEPALWVCEGGSVHPVAFFEAADLLADSGDRARPVGAKHVGELRLDSEYPGESALPLENVPNGHARRLDPDQDLSGPTSGMGNVCSVIVSTPPNRSMAAACIVFCFALVMIFLLNVFLVLTYVMRSLIRSVAT